MWGEGTVLAGRYELRQRIGGGSMGDVWRAVDTVLGRDVAVKILLPALLDDEGFAARFRTEARVLAALSHPGIVSVYDYGQTDDPRTAFLVMELISGRPLSDLLDESAPLSEASMLTIVAQTLEALQAAHDQGIVHRDVKPANLMLRDGAIVVTDFGVARTADARRLTAADVVLGTAIYAAPEQARHSMVTAAADQYAVGVIAYECLTGAPPFDGDTPLGIMMKHLQEPAPPLPDTVSAPVRDLVMRALTKDPAARFASAREMAETARRLASRAAARIGTPEDSFQVGVDVAAVEAAAEPPAAAAPGGVAAGHLVMPEARADSDFMSFTVRPREEAAAEDEDAVTEAGAADPGEAAETSATEEIPPAWASYAMRPPTEGGEDWASFTVGESLPLPDAETVPLPDAETAGVETAGADGAGPMAQGTEMAEDPQAASGSRVVPQDSFTAGVEFDLAAEGSAAGSGGEDSQGSAPRVPAPRAPSAPCVPSASSASSGSSGSSRASAPSNQRRVVVLTGAAVVVAAVVAVALAVPSSGANSSTAGAAGSTGTTQSSAGGSATDATPTDGLSPTPSPTSPSATSATPPKSSMSSAASSSKPPSSGSATTSGGAVASAPKSVPSASSQTSTPAPPPPSFSVAPGPTTTVLRRSGFVTNVGDGDVIDTYYYAGLANLNANAPLSVEPGVSTKPEETFQVTSSVIAGRTVYVFADSLNTKNVIDDSGDGSGKITLFPANNAPNQKWWLARDASMPTGAYYLHNQQFNDCLTDNGAGHDISVKQCATGDKAQEWRLP